MARSRALLGQSPTEHAQPESAAVLLQRLTGIDVARCPVCGDGRMRITAIVGRESRSPDSS